MNSAASTRTALETQKDQEREKIIEQIKNLVAAEAEKVSEFKDTSGDALTSELLNMDGVAKPYKESLSQQYNTIQNTMSEVEKAQENDLNYIKTRLESGDTIPQANLQKVLGRLETNIPKMESTAKRSKRLWMPWTLKLRMPLPRNDCRRQKTFSEIFSKRVKTG